MFGENFQRLESKPLASAGEHTVTLGIPSIKQKGMYTWLEVPIIYENAEELEPSSFSLFEAVDKNDKKQVDDFNRRATAIFDCFDLENNFDPKRFPLWKGKRGKVIIAEDKKGFLVVKKFIKNQSVVDREARQPDLYS